MKKKTEKIICLQENKIRCDSHGKCCSILQKVLKHIPENVMTVYTITCYIIDLIVR